MSFPSNPLLKSWILWIMFQCTLKISYELQISHEMNSTMTVEQQVSNFLYELIYPDFSGSIWSEFSLISFAAIALHIYIVLVVIFLNHYYSLINNIKRWVWFLFIMARFTIGVEPWITIFTSQSPEVLLSFTPLAGILFAADVTFSLIWLVLTHMICELLEKEF